MIEKAPDIRDLIPSSITLLTNNDVRERISKINSEYLYWSKAKQRCPENIDRRQFWAAIKMSRVANQYGLAFGNYHFTYNVTQKMQEYLHHFDMDFGGSLNSSGIIPNEDRTVILNSSIMEEAIASSQMEGASTTRKAAKDMLRKGSKPQDKGQQMIANNYNTIKFLTELKNTPFSAESILKIHKRIASSTLDDITDEGHFRTHNDIVVMNGITGEIAHVPPSHEEIPQLIDELCRFANDTDGSHFIHPIIKAIIIHFMLAYIHPFTDGNGRTARSLFYWFMLKSGYWLTEFLSISRVIYNSKAKYEHAYLYVENDDFDLSYFIMYHLRAMSQAYEELKSYIDKKMHERKMQMQIRKFPTLNERQTFVLHEVANNPASIWTAKEISHRFGVSSRTARNDLQKLVALNLLTNSPIDGRTTGYIKSGQFDEIMR